MAMTMTESHFRMSICRISTHRATSKEHQGKHNPYLRWILIKWDTVLATNHNRPGTVNNRLNDPIKYANFSLAE